jgi:hypothetical protein
MIFSDTLPPSQWWDRNAEETPEPALLNEPELTLIKSHFQRRVTILQQMEEHIRTVEFGENNFKGHFENLTANKVLNKSFPEFESEKIVQASRNMLLIDTMHRKDRWLKEVTEGFERMSAEGRSVQLNATDKPPEWRQFNSTRAVTDVLAYIPIALEPNDEQVIKFLSEKGKRLVEVELIMNETANYRPSLSDGSRTSWPGSDARFKEICKSVHGDCPKAKTGTWAGNYVCDDKRNKCGKLYHLLSLLQKEAEQPKFSDWQNFNRRILEAIEDRRDKLNLGTASRLVALPSGASGPDKRLLENGTISCGPVRWQFWRKTAYHYLSGKNGTFIAGNVPIVCGPGKFYVYNTALKAVLVRLTPAVRSAHLTVPSAWRKLKKYAKVESKKRGWLIDQTTRVNLQQINNNHDNPPVFSASEQIWIVADSETYREMPILRGLSAKKDISLLEETFVKKAKP